MLFMLMTVHRKQKPTILFLLAGVCICVLASELNTIALAMLNNEFFYVTTSVTPLIEEILKSIPVLIFALEFNDRREYVLGAAFAVGVGFAIMENMIIFTSNLNSVNLGMALIRGFVSSLLHAICTGAIGLGISIILAAKKKSIVPLGYFAVLALATTFHGVYNVFVQSDHMVIAMLLPTVSYIAMLAFILTYRKNQKKQKAS